MASTFQKGWFYIKYGISKKKVNEDKMQDELVSYKNFMKDVYKIDICEGWSDGL